MKTAAFVGAIGFALLFASSESQAQYQFAGRLTAPTGDAQLPAGAQQPAVSPDARYLAFVSSSDNLGAASNGSLNLYRHDLLTGTYELATQALGTGNSGAPSISLLGLAIAFPSESNDVGTGPVSGVTDVFYTIRDDVSGDWFTELVSRGVGGTVPNGASQYASLSADARWIAFHSAASNLIAGDGNGVADVFVADALDLEAPPERVSVTDAEAEISGPSRPLTPYAISADGRYVTFAVDETVSIDGSNANTLENVFVRDRVAGTTSHVSKSTAGVAGSSSSSQPSISPSGRYVAFFSFSNNLTPSPSGSRIYLRDRQEGTTTNMPLPPGASSCEDPRVSEYAQLVVQCNMLSGQAQVFLYDPVEGGAFYRLSNSIASDAGGNGVSGNHLGISADGLITTFDSAASDLVESDTNNTTDVFLVVPEPMAPAAGAAVVAALAALRRRRSAAH